MSEYTEQDVIRELVRLYDDDVQGFLAVVLPAGFPGGKISDTMQPAAAYQKFCVIMRGLESSRRSRIVKALIDDDKQGSEVLNGISESTFGAGGNGGEPSGGPPPPPGAGASGRPLEGFEKNRVELLIGRRPEDDELNKCNREGSIVDCYLGGHFLHLLSQLWRASEAMAETRDLLLLLAKLHEEVSQAKCALSSPQPNDPTVSLRFRKLRWAVCGVYSFFEDLPREGGPWPADSRLREYLPRRLRGLEGGTSMGAEDIKAYVKCIGEMYQQLCPRGNSLRPIAELMPRLVTPRFEEVLGACEQHGSTALIVLKEVAESRRSGSYRVVSDRVAPNLRELPECLRSAGDLLPQEQQKNLFVWQERCRRPVV